MDVGPDKDGRGRTDLIVEQVSHHPPITAFHIENKTKGVSLQGHNAQKTSFSTVNMAPSIIGMCVRRCCSWNNCLIFVPRLIGCLFLFWGALGDTVYSEADRALDLDTGIAHGCEGAVPHYTP